MSVRPSVRMGRARVRPRPRRGRGQSGRRLRPSLPIKPFGTDVRAPASGVLNGLYQPHICSNITAARMASRQTAKTRPSNRSRRRVRPPRALHITSGGGAARRGAAGSCHATKSESYGTLLSPYVRVRSFVRPLPSPGRPQTRWLLF